MSGPSFERGYNALKEQIDAPTAAFFSSCVHCGMCAQACLFFTETRDPKYTPIHKLEPLRKVWAQEYTFWGKLGKALGLSKPLTDQDLADWETLAYDSCTLCGRCSMVCPVGNDIAYMIRNMREGMAAAGHAPKGLIGATQRAVTIGSPMGVKLPALQAQIRHTEKEFDVKVPVENMLGKRGEGFRIALNNLDEVIKTIRQSNDAETARTQLMERFGLSQVQAQAILDMQLRRLSALERQKIEDEYQEVMNTIAYLEDLLANHLTFFNHTAPTEFYTLSLRDALPISSEPASSVQVPLQSLSMSSQTRGAPG